MGLEVNRDHEGLQVVVPDGLDQHDLSYSDKQFISASNASSSTNLKKEHGYDSYGAPPELSDSHAPQERKHLGMNKLSLLVLVAVLVAVVVGAAVGGGVAAVLATRSKSQTTNSTPTASAEASVASAGTSQTSTLTRSITGGISTFTSPTIAFTPSTATTTSPSLTSTSSASTNTSPSASPISPTSTATTTSLVSTSTTSSSSTATPTYGSYNCPASNDTTYISGSSTFRTLCDVDWPGGTVAFDGTSTVVDLDAVIATSIDSCIDQCVSYNGDCTAISYGANITLALSRTGITGNCFLKNQRGEENLADTSGQEESAYMI